MCLAIPGKIISIENSPLPRGTGMIADVDFGGIKRKVGLDLLPDARVGNYVIVHAGFAIQILDVKDAKERIKIFEQIS